MLLKSARVTSVDRINEVGSERSEESAFELEAQTLTVNPRENSEKNHLSFWHPGEKFLYMHICIVASWREISLYAF